MSRPGRRWIVPIPSAAQPRPATRRTVIAAATALDNWRAAPLPSRTENCYRAAGPEAIWIPAHFLLALDPGRLHAIRSKTNTNWGVNDVAKIPGIRVGAGVGPGRAHLRRPRSLGAGVRRHSDAAAIRGPEPPLDRQRRM